MNKERFESFLSQGRRFRVEARLDDGPESIFVYNSTSSQLYLASDDILYIDSGESRLQIPLLFTEDNFSFAYNDNLCNIRTTSNLVVSIGRE